MADLQNVNHLVKEIVEDELKAIDVSIGTRGLNKTAKDVIEYILPGITKVISVAVSTAVTSAMTAVMKTFDEKVRACGQGQRIALLNKYECDKLEQYQRRDNLRIFGFENEEGESEADLERKVIDLASDIGVVLKPEEISVVHRVGRKVPDQNRAVIVRFSQRKRRKELLKKKSELKNKHRNEFISEDLTQLRAAMLKMVKERPEVKNATSIEGKLLAWTNEDPTKPITIENPDDLAKVGISNPDWKLLNLQHLINISD